MVSRSYSHSTPRDGARRSTAGGIGQASGHVVEGLDDLGGQGQLLDGQRSLQLGRRAGPDDRGGDAGAVAHPDQRHLERASSPGPRRRGRRRRRCGCCARRGRCRRTTRTSARRRASPLGVPERYFPVSTPRPSGDQGRTPSPSAAHAGSTSGSIAAVEQGVLHLVRGQRRPAGHGALPGRGLRRLPAGVVRDPDVRRPAGRHRRVERRQRLLDGGLVGPDVHLPEVDVVDAEPLQRRVEGAAAGGRARCW